jgi:hypothetical protein
MPKKEVPLKAGTRDETIPAIVYGEQGYVGLNVVAGQVMEQCQEELRWPQAGTTYKSMMADATIASAVELIGIMLTRPKWTVRIPKGYEKQLADKAKYLESCMNDMEHTWTDFLKQAVTAFQFGFCVNEIVLRYRRNENGSKHNDGLVGIKKLPIRSQDTISKWEWSKNTRQLNGLYQNLNPMTNEYSGWDFIFEQGTTFEEKFLKRKKFLLFRNNPYKDSPVGKSPLDGAWLAWKYKTAYQEIESKGVMTDTHGFKILYLPHQYMSVDASDAYKESYNAYKAAMQNIHNAKQDTMILPLLTDEQGNKQFEFDIKNLTGSKAYDVDKIISRYSAEILQCLFADFLALGSNGSGSFSLAESKFSIVEMVIQSKLNEIKDQLNHQLVRVLFEENGFDTTVMPYFDYEPVTEVSLDDLGKFIQRVSAVNQLPRTPEMTDWIMKQANIPISIDPEMDHEEYEDMFPSNETKSGQGLQEGMNDGTGSSNGSGGDSATSNNK